MHDAGKENHIGDNRDVDVYYCTACMESDRPAQIITAALLLQSFLH